MASTGDEDPVEVVRFLARATSRVRIMELLVESGPIERAELRETLDVSQATISRALRSLEDVEWVEQTESEYRLTPTGAVIAEQFVELLETIRTVDEMGAFLEWFPQTESAPDFLDVDDVEVTSFTDADPYAPVRKQGELLQRAERLQLLLPSIGLETTKTIAEQILDGKLEAETIMSPELEAIIESDEFASILQEKTETGRSDVLIADSPVPFYLGLADDELVQIGVEDDEGFPRALLETTDRHIREWAEGVYSQYREHAHHKSSDDF